MKPQVFIEANGHLDDMTDSIVRFGKTARADPDAEVHVYKMTPEQEPERILRQFVGGSKIMKFDLEHGQFYVVLVMGDKVAGVASTSPAKLMAPFNVYLNPPEDHSKDFVRLSVPTNVPIEGDLKRSIVRALRDK